MTNPLTSAERPASGAFGRDLPAGDQRVVTTRDGKVFTIVRTSRPYVYDLRDAYNDARGNAALRRGLEWYVDANGNLRLGFSEAATRQQVRVDQQRRETATARALQRSFEAIP